MARYIVLKDDVVDNIVEWDENYPDTMGWIKEVTPVNIGWKLKEDGSFEPPLEKPAKPLKEVEALAFRADLRKLNKRKAFEEAMQKLGEEAWDEWVYSMKVKKNNLYIIQAATAAGISSADLEDLFKA